MQHIISYLLKHAAGSPQKAAYRFLQDDLEIKQEITYAQLLAQTQRVAAMLYAKALHGERVLLVYKDAAAFVPAFWACAYAGVVPVPVYYPQNKRQYAKIRDIIRDAQAGAILHVGALPFETELLCIDTSEESTLAPMPAPVLHDTAFIQYTSGTTGNPKGVVVNAESLVHNQSLIQQTFHCNNDSQILTWLPFQHDMGLVGNILHAVYVGCTCTVLSPQQFMQQPSRWLGAISKYRISHSGGPDFAYQQCLDMAITSLDLSSWQVAYSGAEPVRATTLERFANKFESVGFNKNAFYPCYGLAEATLLVAGVKASPYPRLLQAGGRTLVSCGKVAAGMSVRIISPETGMEELSGEICIAGDSVTTGYWNKDNSALFYLIDGKLHLRTGDLGYLVDGELFVHARLKEMVILRGRNYYLNDLEETLRQSELGVEMSGIAAFGYQQDEEEQVVIAIEIKDRHIDKNSLAEKAAAADVLINTVYGIRPFDIIFTTPLALPRTTSGKVRRSQCAQQYEAGTFTLLYTKQAADKVELQTVDTNDTGAYLHRVIHATTGLQPQPGMEQHLTEMGVDSVSSMALLNTINKDLGITLDISALLGNATLADLAAMIDRLRGSSSYEPITPVAAAAHYPASSAQQRMWLLDQLDQGGAAYNISAGFYFKETIDAAALEAAFRLVISRHESLRTVFSVEDGVLCQRVLPEMPFTLEEGELRPLDTANGPLLQAKLVRIATDEYALSLLLHHLVADGWSVAVLMQEVLAAYEGKVLPPIEIHYKDYCSWLDKRLTTGRRTKALDSWKQLLPQVLPVLSLPLDHNRPPVFDHKGAVTRYYFSDDMHTRMQQFCEGQQVTLFNLLRGIVYVLLSRYAGQREVITGVPVAGRTHAQLQNQVGLYTNTLPLAATVDPEETFISFIKNISAHALQALDLQELPLDAIIDGLGVKRDRSRNPLFDVMVVQQPGIVRTAPEFNRPGFQLLEDYLGEKKSARAAKVDLTFNFYPNLSGTLVLELEYAVSLFEQDTIDRIFDSFTAIATQVLSQPNIKNGHISIIPDGALFLQQMNAPVGEVTARHILAPILPSFTQFAGQPAILREGGDITYAALAAYIAGVSAKLHEQVPASGQLIGLLTKRSEWLPAYILGILHAGHAYVPLDPAYPQERLQYMLHEAGVATIVLDRELQDIVGDQFTGQLIYTDEWLHSSDRPLELPQGDHREQTAYVIFTSGSTGKPKGVQICHRNTLSFLDWAKKEFADTPYQCLYAATSYCFDLSIFELMVPLMMGKAIRVLPSALDIPASLPADDKVLINTVPSVVKQLNATGLDWSRVAALNIAGEALTWPVIDGIDPIATEIRNLYGPSEDTTYSTMYRITGRHYENIPIGHPISDTQLYILDEHQQPLPVGVPGEIYLSGQGTAKGYIHQPALTAARFLPNPFLPGYTMYRTGDKGKWLKDGQVAFLGRLDNQVKLRGYRIEPDEIRLVLESHPAVQQAIVKVVEEELVGYWIGTGDDTVLRAYAATLLPAYMVPGAWVQLSAFPLTANGKIDMQRLPHPGRRAHTGDVPATYLQLQLQTLWQELLPGMSIGIHQDFFEAGGNSLMMIRLRFLIAGRLQKEVPLSALFAHTTIAAQAQLLEQQGAAGAAITPVAPAPYYPLSFQQERLRILTGFADAAKAYHMSAAFKVHGTLDIARLETAFRRVIAKHEVLRTVFREVDDRQVQVILDDNTFTVQVHHDDIHLNDPFDFVNGPLLRCFVVYNGADTLLSFCVHHLVNDGWSIQVLCRELAAAYKGELSPLSIQYKDFTNWQLQRFATGQLDADLSYWKQQFSEEAPVLQLPADHHRPDLKTYHGDTYNIALPLNIKELARQAGVSLYTALLAIVNILLRKYSGQDDIVTGMPVLGRGHHDLDDQIGFYANTLPVRTKLHSHQSFMELLHQQREILLNALEHQELPFEILLEQLDLRRDLSRSPLFDVMVLLEDTAGVAHITLEPGLYLEQLPIRQPLAKYDLTFSFRDNGHELQLEIEYNTDLYNQATIARMCRHYTHLSDLVVADPGIQLRDIALPDATELALIHQRADRTAASYDTNATLVSIFQEVVQHWGHRTALVSPEGVLNYAQLDQRSSELAALLINEYVVGPGSRVLLHFERGERMLIAIFAVLKAGAAYVPIDPAYPASRIQYIIEDTQSSLMLMETPTPEEWWMQWPDIHFVNVRETPYYHDYSPVDIKPADLAYIIYTSGTTGQPKGVMIDHHNVVRLLFNQEMPYDFHEEDRWILSHSYCFDVSVWEIFGSLLNGAALHIVPKDVLQDSIACYNLLRSREITILNQTPTAFRSLVQQNRDRFATEPLHSVRYLVFAGEALMPEILNEWSVYMPACRNINMYGITETTVHTTFKEITPDIIAGNISNVGIPLPTLSCYVLDTDMQPLPFGITGELYVGGAGVARGYWNRPALTAERFIDDPWHAGSKLYRSGDFARLLPSGDIEYIGRRDDQVKIRGHRIEMGEITTQLRNIQGITDAIVLPRKNVGGEYDLVAYYISDTGLDAAVLRTQLDGKLPAYMVPSYLIPIPAFPLNSNGKLDKPALPDPAHITSTHTVIVGARNEVDETLISIWEEILERQHISIHDNFFNLGGHSLKATRVISRVQQEYGIKVDLKTLFVDPTIAHLSDYISTVRRLMYTTTTDEEEMIL